MSPIVTCALGMMTHWYKLNYLLGTAFQHLLIVLTIGSAQVGTQALWRLIGQLDAVLQQTDGQRALQQWRRLC